MKIGNKDILGKISTPVSADDLGSLKNQCCHGYLLVPVQTLNMMLELDAVIYYIWPSVCLFAGILNIS